MTLPASGIISLQDIATEFGGTAPHELTEYYRGGGLVPDTVTNANIPTSGVLAVTDFYGSSVDPGGITDSYLLLLNDGTPYLPKWDMPGFDNYQALSYASHTTFYSIGRAKNAYITALGGQTSPYWKVLDGSLTDITPSITLANRSFSIAVSDDGRYVAAAHHQTSPYITVIDLSDNSTSQPAIVPTVRPGLNATNQVAWNRAGDTLALCGSQGDRLQIYDMPAFTLASSQPVAYNTSQHSSIVFSDDDTWAVAALSVSPYFVVYDTSDWSVITTVNTSGKGLTCLDYSASLGLIASGSADGDVYLYDVDTWTLVDSDSTHAVGGNGTTSVSFSYDNNYLLTTHNFGPFAVVYDMPGFTENAFEPLPVDPLDYLSGGLFIPKA